MQGDRRRRREARPSVVTVLGERSVPDATSSGWSARRGHSWGYRFPGGARVLERPRVQPLGIGDLVEPVASGGARRVCGGARLGGLGPGRREQRLFRAHALTRVSADVRRERARLSLLVLAAREERNVPPGSLSPALEKPASRSSASAVAQLS